MICQECKERPATLHFTKVVNGEKTAIQLCEKCAQEKGEFFMMDGAGGFSFNDLLAGLLNLDPSIQQAQSAPSPTHQIIQCEVCKMTFQQFINIGRFGCANCYEAFKGQMTPILKRLHSGNIQHGGKVPKRIGGSIHLKKQVQLLKEELRSLVVQEEFEKAAEVRDQIRSLENNLSNGEGKSR
ncbi:UvrB/UvrC motif-containing protein [Lederbergia citrea]|uniref:UvrB/UvrC motif-containing protein n=1 Tax=Lederbergia citrea TaxID=2833581 RepID=A0A942URM9_9BACI|nr:UvrB/UvrC motif-containing protein [Lederbergia citrea]MBS4179703.1 UvrB/UvrC motif-containing protein [Lederbergia citrea]MBS4206389.1 UvrB/UvrC motif-containing protein [Lederbergia citrea]MBS4224917.1 UvrB/UvrC motif-containing protein [Lederbergia citrea]